MGTGREGRRVGGNRAMGGAGRWGRQGDGGRQEKLGREWLTGGKDEEDEAVNKCPQLLNNGSELNAFW